MDYTSSEEGKMELAHSINNARNYLNNLQSSINEEVNLRKPLKKDFNNFMETIKTKLTDS